MKNKIYKISILFLFVLLTKCKTEEEIIKLNFSNNSNHNIVNKTIEVPVNKLPKLNLQKLNIFDNNSNKSLVYQIVDINKDEQADQLLFQLNIPTGKSTSVTITQNENIKKNDFPSKVYARFVPERKDDFAWENDRIAYRMYGPALEATGEISNGIDVWVKSTKSLILDKWYKSEDYHTDHGEGLDCYKVGTTLGAGGSALFESDTLNKSKNFVKWNIIANGPIRTIFELTYAPRKYKGANVTEIKRISLDAGSNLNKIEVKYLTTDNVKFKNVIGVVKHKGIDKGKVNFNKEKGIFVYWEPTSKENGNTAIGVIVNPDEVDKLLETEQHYLIVMKETVKNNFTYYAGAAWSKSGDFNSYKDWINYLDNFNRKFSK